MGVEGFRSKGLSTSHTNGANGFGGRGGASFLPLWEKVAAEGRRMRGLSELSGWLGVRGGEGYRPLIRQLR
jgi:hypothetical protein